ncbi:MAG: hypothetical protein JW786_12940 [Desulfobacterales bacterium]|nr:hypothetical protein [Desulfobacterales bacterium]
MEQFNHIEIRCPRLGGEVTFAYCRKEDDDLPCPRIIKCWQAYFPVEQFLKEKLTSEQWKCFCSRLPKDKITTIFEIVEEIKKKKKDRRGVE